MIFFEYTYNQRSIVIKKLIRIQITVYFLPNRNEGDKQSEIHLRTDYYFFVIDAFCGMDVHKIQAFGYVFKI